MGETKGARDNRRPPGEPREEDRRPPEKEEVGKPRSRPSPIGKGDTPAVAGSDQQQPEIAEGPVEGLQPDEKVERGRWQPPLDVDAPEGTAVPRDAGGRAGEGPPTAGTGRPLTPGLRWSGDTRPLARPAVVG